MKSAKTVRLGDVCEVVRERVPVEDTPLARYVTTDSLVKNLGGRAEAEALPPSGSLVAYRKGDLLLSNIRPYLRKLWLADGDGGCSNDIIVLRPCHEINANYLRLVLSQDDFFSYVMRDVSGTKMPRGKREHIMRFTLPLLPLSEQKAIAARLNAALARATRLAEHFTTIAKNADLSFKATLAETFENVSGKEVRLGDVSEVVSSRGHQIPQSAIQATGQWPVVSQSEQVIEGFTDEAAPITKVPLVLFGDHTCCIKLIKEPFIVGADGTKLLFPTRVEASYFYYFCRNAASRLADGRYRRHFSDLMALSIPLPPLSVQREIVARLDAARVRSEGIAELARRGAAAAENLKKALLKEAFE